MPQCLWHACWNRKCENRGNITPNDFLKKSVHSENDTLTQFGHESLRLSFINLCTKGKINPGIHEERGG